MEQKKKLTEKRLFIQDELHTKIKIIAILKECTQEKLINEILSEWMDNNYSNIVQEKFNY
jgi:hypothetical protein